MTHYDLLGVKESASKDEIKRAFRKKAAELHPDKNPGDPTAEPKFKEVNEAYQVLSDDEKRRVYDAQLHMKNVGFGGMRSRDPHDPFSIDADLASRFEEMFGFTTNMRRPSGRRTQVRGSDVSVKAHLDMREALLGHEAEVKFKCAVTCTDCSGRGSKTGKEDACSQCSGRGQVHQNHGPIRFTMTCPVCEGAGTVVSDQCQACSGSGTCPAERKLKVKLPAGIDTGDTLRIVGQGNAGRAGGQAGNVFVTAVVTPIDGFHRDGLDILIEKDVSFTTLALGGRVTIDLLDGSSQQLTVEPMTQPGTIATLERLGFPVIDSTERGDVRVMFNVAMPSKISPDAKKKLEELRELL